MKNPVIIWITLSGLILLSCVCSPSGLLSPNQAAYSNIDYKFTYPSSWTTKNITYHDSFYDADQLEFINGDGVYIAVFQRSKLEDQQVKSLIEPTYAKINKFSGYNLISEKEITFGGLPALQFIYDHFHGEPYQRTIDTWVEKNDHIYIINCSFGAPRMSSTAAESQKTCEQVLGTFQFTK